MRLRPSHALVALAALVAVTLSAFVAYDLRREYLAEIEAAGATTRNLARLLEEHARQSLSRVDIALTRAADEVRRAGDLQRSDRGALRQRLIAQLPQDGLIGAFGVIAADGRSVVVTLDDDPRSLPSVADRDYFVAHRERADLRMVIGAAVRSRADGKWILPVSRRIESPGGGFGGVMLAVVEPVYFRRFYDSIDTGANGFVTLFERQGWVVARSPFDEKQLGRNWSDTPMFREHLPVAPAKTVRQVVVADGVEHIYSYRALQEFPVVMSVGLSLTDILAPWRRRAWTDGAILLVVLAALAGATLAITGQLRQREAAERALQESEARFRGLTGLSSDWYWEQDSELRLTFMSNSFGEKMGVDAGPYLGQPRWELPALNLTEADWERHRAVLLRHEPFRDFEMHRAAGDGKTVWASISGEPLFDASGAFRGYRGVGRDITGRKRREALLEGEKQVLEMVAENEPLEQVLAALMRILEAQAPGMLCSVLLLDAGGEHLRHGAAPSLPEDYIRAIEGMAIGPNAGSCGTAAFRREPVIAEDIAADPLWADYREPAMRHGLRACWSTPIFDSQRRVLGTFAVYYRQPGRPAVYHEWLLGVATHIAAIAISRRDADAALRNARQRLEIALEGSQISIWESDPRTGEVWLDPGWAVYLGQAAAETQTTNAGLLELVHPEDRAAIADAVSRAMKGGIASYAVEHRVKAAGGEWKWILSRGRVTERDAEGRPLRMSGTNADITTCKHAELALAALNAELESRIAASTESLRQARDRLEFLLSAAPAVIYSARPHGDYAVSYISANVHAVLGYEPEDFVRDAGFWPGNLHLDDRDRVFADLATLEKSGALVLEYRYRHKDGSWRWMQDGLKLVRDASGAPDQLVGYWVDVTQRRRAEDALRETELRHRAILATAMDGFWRVDAQGRLLEVNDTYCRMSGYSEQELLTMHIRDLEATEDAGEVAAHMKRIAAKGEDRFESRHRRKDGSVFDIEASVQHQSADGSAVAFVRNIAGKKRIQRQLDEQHAAIERASRMKSEFMANVTHELRTPLNSVIGFAELLKEGVPGPLNAQQAAFAANILAAGRQLLALVEGILEMSRLDAAGAALAREPVEIGAALEERVAAHRKAAAARRVTIRLAVAADAGSAALDPKALRRMLDALIDNAVKFSNEGGQVAVSARRAGGRIEIAVADTGIGIAPEDLSKLFKPLVQLDTGLARRHGGVGLGLALARRLAELHGGTIEVESDVGKGSSFTLRLPIQEGS